MRAPSRGVGLLCAACLGLLGSGRANAEPSGQWGAAPDLAEGEVEAEEAEPSAEEPEGGEEDGPASAAEGSVEATPEPAEEAKPREKARARASAKGKGNGKGKSKSKGRSRGQSRSRRGPPPPPSPAEKSPQTLQAEFEEATRSGERVLERRRRAEERAAEQVERAPLEAARDLAVIAELDDDPALMVGAAEAALAGVGVVPGAEEAAQLHVSAAKARIEALSSSDDENALLRLGLDDAELHQLEVRLRAATSRANVALVRSRRAEERARSLRIAKGEVISGAVLAGLGASGLAMMGSGIYLGRSADRELEAAGVDSLSELDAVYRAPFEQQYEQASTLTAVGAVVGAVGLALGGTLVAAGVRDLKRIGGGSGRRASLHGAPSVSRGAAGFVVGGRF